jgi:hypothetical protein
MNRDVIDSPQLQLTLLFQCTKRLGMEWERLKIYDDAFSFNGIVDHMKFKLIDISKEYFDATHQTNDEEDGGFVFTYEQKILITLIVSQMFFELLESVSPEINSITHPVRKFLAVFGLIILFTFTPFSLFFSAETCFSSTEIETTEPLTTCKFNCCRFQNNCAAIDDNKIYLAPMLCRYLPQFSWPEENVHWNQEGYVLIDGIWTRSVPFIDGKQFRLNEINPIFIDEFDEMGINLLKRHANGPGMIANFQNLYKVYKPSGVLLWIILFLSSVITLV